MPPFWSSRTSLAQQRSTRTECSMKRGDARTPTASAKGETMFAAVRREGTGNARSPVRTRHRRVEIAGSALTRLPDKWTQEDSANESADLSRCLAPFSRYPVTFRVEPYRSKNYCVSSRGTEIRARFVL